ncbi:hypothetical protein L484_002081 [Morus notabilis]|uniref:DUF569 domain-containing protein n=1 Tax=Morus notabilis TaxID=981085 RepID=W9QN59_9ROSA|nr:hypothetical protein L484_002081 [Morus notabilis]
MEFFNKAKAVRLKSHLDKYLNADDDEETVRQNRNGSSRRAWWKVELVDGKSHVIRLKSFYGKYLTAWDEPFLLGMTGKRVLQTTPASENDTAMIEWEPRTEAFQVKLRTRGGKYLRANGGTPPWRNSVTHDVPHRTATQNWIIWSVDVVDIDVVELMTEEDSVRCRLSPTSSLLSSFSDLSDTGSPLGIGPVSRGSGFGSCRESAMELFQKVRVVRLRSHHEKYLLADDDEESVCQHRNGSVRNARWTVEIVDNTGANVLRFKSCYGKYLTASNMPFLLGMTGKKVLQTLPTRLDSSTEWEPIREGFQVRLKTRYGQFLRANGGLPPWRNSITHDIPHRTSTQDWVLWDVDVVELRPRSPKRSLLALAPSSPPPDASSEPDSPTKFELTSSKLPSHESSDLFDGLAAKAEGRTIYYHVSNENEDEDEAMEELFFAFKGNGVEELKEKLKEETGLHDIVVCSRNPLNGKLYPLRLHLPPNNTDMHVVVVPSSSEGN